MCDKTLEETSNLTNYNTINQITQHINNLNMDSTVDSIDDDLGEGTSYGSYESKLWKDSFNRFDDNFVQLFLSYLTFSEKVMFESVSKQWKKVIYNEQKELHLNSSETEENHTLNKLLKTIVINDYATGYAFYSGLKAINKESLESVLKKCKFIEKIEMGCYCDGEDLLILGKYCNNLKSIECEVIGFNEQNLVEFGIKYGYLLKSIHFYNTSYGSVFFKKFLKHCNNLLKVNIDESKAFMDEEKLFLPKLQVIKSLQIRSENLSDLKILSEKYSETMQKISIYCYYLINNETQTALSYISRLQYLKRLELYLYSNDPNITSIDENIIEIANNCTQLKELVYNNK